MIPDELVRGAINDLVEHGEGPRGSLQLQIDTLNLSLLHRQVVALERIAAALEKRADVAGGGGA